MAFIERGSFGAKVEHPASPERGLDQLEQDLEEAATRVETALSSARGIQEQLALWNEMLKETDASLASPDARKLVEHTRNLHNLYRKAVREFSAAMKDLNALAEAHKSVAETAVLGRPEIGEA